MKRGKSKRGAEFTVTTLIVIVLAILVLAVLALGFGIGFGNLWDRIANYFSSPSNVDTVKAGCEYACTSQAQYAWCSQIRDLKWGKETTQKAETTCDNWAKNGIQGATPNKIDSCSNIPTCPA